MNSKKLTLKQRKIILISLITLVLAAIVLLSSLYISFSPIASATIAVGIFLFISALILIIGYSAAGFISFIIILMNAVLAFTALQILEVDFSWYVYISLILGIGISVDGAIVVFENIKSHMMNGDSFKKSYKSILKGNKLSLVDSYLMSLVVTLTMFFVGFSAISDLSVGMIITVTIAILTMGVLNKFMVYMLFTSEIIKSEKKLFWYKNDFDKKLNKRFSKFNYMKFSKKVLLATGIFAVLAALVISVLLGLENDGVKVWDQNRDPSFSGALITRLVISILIMASLIFIYVAARISWTYAAAAVITLIHDVVFVLLFFIITRMHLSEIVVGALMLILAYSVNDTIVIFDKIKEKFMTHSGEVNKESLSKIINSSIVETMRRSIFTSVVLFIAVLIPLFFGSAVWFNIASLLGIIVGSLSSIFIAPVIWSKLELWRITRAKKREEEKFWVSEEKEEQIIVGINDYRP